MENRAYAFAFFGVLGIICLGAYVAVSALTDTNGDPLIRFGETNGAPTAVALATRPPLSRTPTPTITPFIPIIPMIIFPTATPVSAVPATPTATLPPFPTPRLLPTRTPTAGDTPTTAPNVPPTNTPAPPPPSPAGATNTPVPPPPPPPSNFPYRVENGPSVNRSRGCGGGIYYIYGFVRDAQGQPLSRVRVRYTTGTIFPPDAVTEAKGFELTVGTADADWFISIVDGNGTALSPTVKVHTAGLYNGDCWFQLNWRHN